MKNNNNFLLTETQTEFIKNSLSEFKSKPSTQNIKKPSCTYKKKERDMMLTFLLGEDYLFRNTALSIRKRNLLQRNLRMRMLFSPIKENRLSRNNCATNEHSYLPSINSANRSSKAIKNSSEKSGYVPHSISYIEFPRINKSAEHKVNISSLNSSKNNINSKNINVTSSIPQETSMNSDEHKTKINNNKKQSQHKKLKTDPTLIPQKQNRSINIKQRLQHPKILYLHNLHKQMQRRSKKCNPTILFGNYFTDIYELNAKHPPSEVKIDSFISRTYESNVFKTPSSSFVLSDIFNFRGFCIYGICEGNISSPKAPLISSISRDCLSTHLTDPMAFNLKNCSSIADVLTILTDNDFELIKNAFTSVKDEFAQANIKEDIKEILNVMLLILIHNEIIVCALGSSTKGYWFEFEEDKRGKEIMNSYRIINNEGMELYIERINYEKRMKFILFGSRRFWERMLLYNLMKIISNKRENVSEMVDKIYEYKQLVLQRKGFYLEENKIEEDLEKYLLYSVIILKF